MNILQNIKKWLKRSTVELTPRGECLARYCKSLIDGSDIHIQAYDEIIESTKNLLEEMYNMEISFDETVELMGSYFYDYFDIG